MNSVFKIFIINLKSSVSRKEALKKRLDELNLSAEFIEAVNGYALSNSELTQHTLPLNYAYMRGEVGCALSHQFIYKKMVAENITSALILEDDVNLPDNLAFVLSQITMSESRPEVTLLSRVNKFRNKKSHSFASGLSLHRIHQASTAHAYIINRPGAANLLAALYPVWMVADKWSLFEDYGWVNVNAVVPAPVTLSSASTDSTINSQKGNEEVAYKKRALWSSLMQQRPLKVKIRSRLKRALIPLIYGVTDQKKGP